MSITPRNGRWIPAAAVFLLGSLSAVASLHSPRSFAADDDEYTRAIRGEGNRLEALNKPAEAPPPATPAAPPAKAQSPEEFEKALRAEAPASQRFYDELDASRKRQVYELYLKEGRITDVVKRFIVKLRLGA